MKVLIYTDNHFCENSSILRLKGDKYSYRLENQIKSINWVENLAQEKGCEQIIQLGDFFDKATLNSQELTALKEIQWTNLSHTFLCGNHEMGSNDLEYNSLNALSKIGEVIIKPKMVTGYGYEIIYLPYILEANRKPLDYYIEQLEKENYTNNFTTQEVKNRIILSHNDISGIQYGPVISKQGFTLGEINKNGSLFINGHIHNQEKINEKVINLGNLTGLNFNEDGLRYKHSVMVLDTDTLEYELIDNPYALYFYKLDSLQKVKDNINRFSKDYSIATIKIKEDENEEAGALCDKLFKTYRLLTVFEQVEELDNNTQLLDTDYITQFKNYCLQSIGNSDVLKEELSQL